VNRDDDFNRTLEAWLRREAPPQAPDRVLESAVQRVSREPQRRSWQQVLVGETPMATFLRAAALVVVSAIAVIGGLQISKLIPDVGESSPSPTASASPSESPPAIIAPDGVLPPYSVVVVLKEIELRERPGTSGEVFATIPPGQTVWIQGSGEFGPVTIGGTTYYPATYALNFARWPAGADGGFSGWVPTARDGVPLVELPPSACPAVDALSPAVLASMTAWAQLSCYGESELVLQGSWVFGDGGIWPWDGEPAWLVPPDVLRAISDGDGQFYFVLAPAAVVPAALESGGGIVRITGHYDDPAASTCVIRAGEPLVEQPAASVRLFCREKFVVTNVELVEAVGCPDSPPDVSVLYDLPDPVACFGNAALTFDAHLAAAGVVDCPGEHEPPWIYCPAAGWLTPVGQTDHVGVPFLLVAVDPASGEDLSGTFDRDVHVTGHFDDPAAQTCREIQPIPEESPRPASEMIQICRRTFVVTQVVPLEP
jgi:hypothetical protein